MSLKIELDNDDDRFDGEDFQPLNNDDLSDWSIDTADLLENGINFSNLDQNVFKTNQNKAADISNLMGNDESLSDLDLKSSPIKPHIDGNILKMIKPGNSVMNDINKISMFELRWVV